MRSKKALFFTLISFIFLFILIMAYKIDFDYKETSKAQSVMSRVNVMNDFIDSLEQDAERALYISGLRSIISYNNYIMQNNDPIDVDVVFGETMMSGTIKGDTAILMDGQTLPVWESRVVDIADDLDLTLTLDISGLELKHDTPWSVRASMMLNYTLVDQRGVARFNRSSRIGSSILIVDLQDPLYIFGGIGQNQIRRADYVVSGPASLKSHISSGYYINSTDAPSFLMRLNNDIGSSIYGIESMINASLGNDENLSCVDYIYLDPSSPDNQSYVVNVTDTYGWFKLDTDHCLLFNVNCS